MSFKLRSLSAALHLRKLFISKRYFSTNAIPAFDVDILRNPRPIYAGRDIGVQNAVIFFLSIIEQRSSLTENSCEYIPLRLYSGRTQSVLYLKVEPIICHPTQPTILPSQKAPRYLVREFFLKSTLSLDIENKGRSSECETSLIVTSSIIQFCSTSFNYFTDDSFSGGVSPSNSKSLSVICSENFIGISLL